MKSRRELNLFYHLLPNIESSHLLKISLDEKKKSYICLLRTACWIRPRGHPFNGTDDPGPWWWSGRRCKIGNGTHLYQGAVSRRGFVVLKNKYCLRNMLTLDSWWLPVLGWGVLYSKTRPNGLNKWSKYYNHIGYLWKRSVMPL